MRTIIDLTGKIIRNWTILNKKIINNKTYWECQCKCGNISNIINWNLLHLNYNHCIKCKPVYKAFGVPPPNKINLTELIGKKFGSLTLIKEIEPKKMSGQFRRFVLCQCDCGQNREINLKHLLNGHTKSCGCLLFKKDEFGFIKNRRKKYKTKTGYIKIYAPNHPNCDRNEYVLEHVLVMSKLLGRPIKKGETIHHRNGIRDDNKEENLELWTHSHPHGQRVKDVYEFCLKYINKYKEIYNKTKNV